MNCEECLEKLSAYLDEALSSSEMDQMNSHIAKCSCCKEQMIILQEVLNTLGQLEEVTLPETFHEELMKKIKEENREKNTEKDKVKKFYNAKWIYWAGGMAATLLVGMVWLLQPPQEGAENPQLKSMPQSARSMPQSQEQPAPFAAAEMPIEDEGMASESWTSETKDLAKLEKWLEDNSNDYGYQLQITTGGEGTYMRLHGLVDKAGLIEALKAIEVEIIVDQPSDTQDVTLFIKK